MDLSHADWDSVNEYIDKIYFSLAYCTVDDAFMLIIRAGKGNVLVKLDIKHTFRPIPVRLAPARVHAGRVLLFWHSFTFRVQILPFFILHDVQCCPLDCLSQVEILASIKLWESKTDCNKTELLSLIASFQFAAKCVLANCLF